MQWLKCMVCEAMERDPVFLAPHDEIGLALMQAHLAEHRREGDIE